jgi:MFS transporter, DHA2 family, methylenomycin A resistance protein
VPTSNAAPADNTPIAAVEPSQARITLLLASLGFFLITLDIPIVNVALAQISRELGGGTVGQQWVVDGYTVLFASLLLFAGNFADRIGAKRAFSIGVALFGLTSAGCALAPTIGSLIAARAGQVPPPP